MKTSDWDEAAATRDLYLQGKAAQRAAGQGAAPKFSELAERYLKEATAHLAGSTLEDRNRLLEDGGLLTAYFGPMRISEVRRATLLEWWHREVEGKGRHERTGLTYLSALSGVFGYAVDLELLEANPADALRGTLRRRRRSKRGRHAGPPKSGRSRRVALSRRLRGLLREFYIARGRPKQGERVLPGFHVRNYQTRHFEPVCTAAKLPRHTTPKDLRDTYASQLLTAGIQLGYISVQLGHADVATTARHYARWTGDGAYRQALAVEPGEVPADLLARMETLVGAAEVPPHFSPHLDQVGKNE